MSVSAASRDALEGGFGDDRTGEDRFDAAIGLLAMLAVVLGSREAGAPNDRALIAVEGWILSGRSPRADAIRPSALSPSTGMTVSAAASGLSAAGVSAGGASFATKLSRHAARLTGSASRALAASQ